MMRKEITLRYAGKCKLCGQTIPAGHRAVYMGKGNGVIHPYPCTADDPNKPAPDPPKPVNRTFQITYGELRNAFLAARDSGDMGHGIPNTVSAKRARELGTAHWARFAGASLVETEAFLRNGYRV